MPYISSTCCVITSRATLVILVPSSSFYLFRLTRTEIHFFQVAASCVNEEQKMQQLQQLYEAEVDAYKITIQRVAVHPDI